LQTGTVSVRNFKSDIGIADMPRFILRHALKPVIIMGLLVTASAGQAADGSGKFSIRGPGSQSCAAYLAAAGKPEDHARYASWLLGYASARNRIEPNTYDFIPTEAGTDFPNIVTVICKSNGKASVEQAAHSAITALAPMRQASASPLVEVQADGKAVKIHQEALRTLQTALIAKKAFSGRADGLASTPLVAALKEFQRKESIPVTGLPDIDTFIRAVIKR